MPNSKRAGRLPNQCYFLSQHQTNCLFICFSQTKGALLSNTRAGEICLLIKMLHIVFLSPRSRGVLQKRTLPKVHAIDQRRGKWKTLSLRTHGAAACWSAFKEPRTTVRRGGGAAGWWAVFFFLFKIQFQYMVVGRRGRQHTLVHMIHQMHCLCLDFTFKGEKSIH